MTRVAEITRLDALERLRPEWSELWERCPAATPFQSPEWLLSWWRCFSPGDLLVLEVRESSGRLIGLAPLFIQPAGEVLRHVSFVGSGISDYLDILAEPDLASVVAREVVMHLARHPLEWERCDLGNLCTDSPLLVVPKPDELRTEIYAGETCSFVPLPESVDEYVGTLPWHLRRDLRSGWNRLARSGEGRFEEAGRSSLKEALEAFFRLHRARWRDRGLPGVVADEAMRIFHREVAAGMLARAHLRLYTLSLDQEIVAVVYGFARAQRLYFYLSGFDPRVKRLSPGSLLLHQVIQRSIAAGLKELDFLRGNEPYKREWGARERLTWRLVLLNRSAAQAKAVPARAAASRSTSSLPTNRMSAPPIP